MVNLVCAQISGSMHTQLREGGVSVVSSTTYLQPLMDNDICPTGACLVSAFGVVTWVSSLVCDLLEVRHHLIIIVCPVMN